MLQKNSSKDKLSRNRVQDRIMMASNQLCEQYKVVLKKKQSNANFWFGTASTTFGAAGAVASGVQAAKNLSALSGLTSGVRAEYNQSYFSDLAAQVVTKGIDARRSEILEKINEAKLLPIEEYTLEASIADAISYHGACSLISGLEQADGAVTKLTTPVGLDALFANPAYKAKVKAKEDEQAEEDKEDEGGGL